MNSIAFDRTIELYCSRFLPEAMKHYDTKKGGILDATGAVLQAALSDENPYYKGFIIIVDEDAVWEYQHRMITRPNSGPRKSQTMKTTEDFFNYFAHEHPSDLVYFLDTHHGVFMPVKGQLKNFYESLPSYGSNITIDDLLNQGSLPANYLDKEEKIPITDIGGRTEAGIMTSAKYPKIHVVVANQRAYGIGMGKVSLFSSGKLISDFRFELGGEVQVYEGISGIVTQYEQWQKKRLPVSEQYVYFDNGVLRYTDEQTIRKPIRSVPSDGVEPGSPLTTYVSE